LVIFVEIDVIGEEVKININLLLEKNMMKKGKITQLNDITNMTRQHPQKLFP